MGSVRLHELAAVPSVELRTRVGSIAELRVVRYDYDLCRNEDTGGYGYLLELGWTSLVGEGFDTRPATWHPLP